MELPKLKNNKGKDQAKEIPFFSHTFKSFFT